MTRDAVGLTTCVLLTGQACMQLGWRMQTTDARLPLLASHSLPHRRLPAAQGAAVCGAAQALPGERCDGTGHTAGPPPRVPHAHGARHECVCAWPRPLLCLLWWCSCLCGCPKSTASSAGCVCYLLSHTWSALCRRVASPCPSTSLWTATTCQRGRPTHVRLNTVCCCAICSMKARWLWLCHSACWRRPLLPGCSCLASLVRRSTPCRCSAPCLRSRVCGDGGLCGAGWRAHLQAVCGEAGLRCAVRTEGDLAVKGGCCRDCSMLAAVCTSDVAVGARWWHSLLSSPVW